MKKLLTSVLVVFSFIILFGSVPTQAKEKVKLSKTKVTLAVSESKTIKLKNAKAKLVQWSVEDPDVAIVDNGIITALKFGETKVTATYKNKTYTCKVRVIHRESPIKVDPSWTVEFEDASSITYSIEYKKSLYILMMNEVDISDELYEDYLYIFSDVNNLRLVEDQLNNSIEGVRVNGATKYELNKATGNYIAITPIKILLDENTNKSTTGKLYISMYGHKLMFLELVNPESGEYSTKLESQVYKLMKTAYIVG